MITGDHADHADDAAGPADARGLADRDIQRFKALAAEAGRQAGQLNGLLRRLNELLEPHDDEP
jgi:hypothetical protein